MPGEDAFDALYLRTRDRLAVQVQALTADRAEARDVVQEAFVRAWQRWDRVGAYDDPEAWVRRVAYREAVSRWRKARRLVLGGGRPERSTRSDDASAARMDLVAALRELPLKQREALVLRHFAGLPVAEVAAEMGVPEGTAKTWLLRGRHSLELLLGAEGLAGLDP